MRKDSEIYRKVAERIEKGFYKNNGVCGEISTFLHRNYSAYWERPSSRAGKITAEMREWFDPHKRRGPWWLGDPRDSQTRILALCFMAAIKKREGK